MLDTVGPGHLRAMASECRNAADALFRLQCALQDLTEANHIEHDMIGPLQSLDIVHQTVADLGHLLDGLTASEHQTAARRWEEGLARIQQVSLRNRLMAPSLSDEEPGADHSDVEVW